MVKQSDNQFRTLASILLLFVTIICNDVANAGIDFNTMLNALKNNAVPIIKFVIAVAYIVGIWFIVSAILELKKLVSQLL